MQMGSNCDIFAHEFFQRKYNKGVLYLIPNQVKLDTEKWKHFYSKKWTSI
jgi:hypothetical protein